MKLLRRLIRILNGEYCVDISLESKVVFRALAAIHFVLLLFFFSVDAWLMVGANVLSIIAYLFGSRKCNSRNYVALGAILCSEVMIHMFLAVISIGWNSSFCLYIIALIPATYYCAYNAKVVQQKRMNVCLVVMSALLVILMMRSITYFIDPLYQIPKDKEYILSMVNSVAAIVTITYIMTIFASSVNSSEYLLKLKNRQLMALANTDPLTELYNRRGMQKRLESAIYDVEKNASSFCLVLGDIDNFKCLNDTYGHECGDFALVSIAETIRKQIRENDYICRWGGEEILILFNNCKENMAAEVTEKLRRTIEENTITYMDQQVKFTMTFGVQEYIIGCHADEIIRMADIKLYVGKKNGKNQVVTDIERIGTQNP